MKMKKLLCLSLSVLMVVSMAGCKKEEKKAETLKFGMGVVTEVSKASNAEEDANGQGQTVSNVAVVTVDAEGKIVACQLDTADATVAYLRVSKHDFLGYYYNQIPVIIKPVEAELEGAESENE